MNTNLLYKKVLSSISTVCEKKEAIKKLVENQYKFPKELVFQLRDIFCRCSLDANVIARTIDEEITKIEINEGHNRIIVNVNRCNYIDYAIDLPKGFKKELQDALEKRVAMFVATLK